MCAAFGASLGGRLVAAATVGLMWPAAPGWGSFIRDAPSILVSYTSCGVVSMPFTVPAGVTAVTADATGADGGLIPANLASLKGAAAPN